MIITRRAQLLAFRDCDDLAIKVVSLHESLQLQVLSIVLAWPSQGVRIAKRMGVSNALFLARDLLLIWCACCVAAELNRDRDVLIVARLGLTAEHFYGRFGLWNADKLAALADRFHPWPPLKTLPAMQKLALRFVVSELMAAHRALLRMDVNTRDTLKHLIGATRALPHRQGGSVGRLPVTRAFILSPFTTGR